MSSNTRAGPVVISVDEVVNGFATPAKRFVPPESVEHLLILASRTLREDDDIFSESSSDEESEEGVVDVVRDSK
jgi:hypothetical protein